jgi:hypothetical protein
MEAFEARYSGGRQSGSALQFLLISDWLRFSGHLTYLLLQL